MVDIVRADRQQGRRAHRTLRQLSCAVLLLGTAASGCVIPSLTIEEDGSSGGSGGGGPSSGGTGGDASDLGGDASGGGGGGGDGGTESGGGSSGGGSPSGGSSSGGDGSGGDGSGGEEGGGSVGPEPGYLASGDWHGFLYTQATTGNTIDESAVTSALAAPYCVDGEVAGTQASTGLALLGWNLNQEGSCTGTGCVPPTGVVSPTEEGILIETTNSSETLLRVQIQGADGETDASQRWCIDFTEGGERFIPWAAFNTSCWNRAQGTPYAGDDIEALALVVPDPGQGNTTAFAFCLDAAVAAAAPACTTIVATDTYEFHQHELVVPPDERLLGIDRTYLTGDAGGLHTHGVTITADEFVEIANGDTVTVTSSVQGDGHSHDFLLDCE